MLVGYSESDGNIIACSAEGTIVSTGSGNIRIGGLVSDTSSTSVIRCSSAVDITVSDGILAVGGVIGWHSAHAHDDMLALLLDGCIYTGSVTKNIHQI